MKRSEVIDQLIYFLEDFMTNCDSEEDVKFYAQEIFEYLENEVKMLPPLRVFKEMHPQWDIHGPIGSKLIEVKRREWEPEDET